MTNDLHHITDKIRHAMPALQREYNVRRLGVFGSVARGDQKSASDVDILVEFSKPIGLFRFVALEQRLEELLGCGVDLATKNALKPFIKDTVLRQTVYV